MVFFIVNSSCSATRLDLIHQTENAQILFIDRRRALLKIDSVAKEALFGFFVTFFFAAKKNFIPTILLCYRYRK